jgi:hypothetical protein
MTEAEWWTEGHTSVWERLREVLKRDWEQTKADLTGKAQGQDLPQEVSDTVKQGTGEELIPPSGVPNRPAMKEFGQAEPALRYGVGARSRYAADDEWNETLEGKLAREWVALASTDHWDDAKELVRRGWEASRSLQATRVTKTPSSASPLGKDAVAEATWAA